MQRAVTAEAGKQADALQGEARASEPRTRNGPDASILGLQRSAGNRAVLSLLGGAGDHAASDCGCGSRCSSCKVNHAPPLVLRTLQGSGRALDRSTRSVMERRFHRDLGGVRVHTGDLAARSAKAVGAHAYTVGRQIVFDSGRYAPATPIGRGLLAHEIAHTLQQPAAIGAGPIPVNEPGEHAEPEADALARGTRKDPTRLSATRLQRVSAGESFLRFIGFLFGYEGSFDDEELLGYLGIIETKKGPEGGLYSDNRARAVVRKWKANDPQYELSALIRAILIEEMLDGIVVEGDQNAILDLLEGSNDTELTAILARVSRKTIEAGVDNEGPKKRLKKILDGYEGRLKAGLARTGAEEDQSQLGKFLVSLTDPKREHRPDERVLAREVVKRWKADDPRFILEVERKTELVKILSAAPAAAEDGEAILALLLGAKPGEVDIVIRESKLEKRVASFPEEQRNKLEAAVERSKEREKDEKERGVEKVKGDWIEHIVVDQEPTQTVTAHWNSGREDSDIASTGKGHCCVETSAAKGGTCSEAESRIQDTNCTPIGDHKVQALRPQSAGGIPFWTEFVTFRGIALHPYTPVDGTPLSHGCVRLHEAMAQMIWHNSRKDKTTVKVKGLARPRCDNPTLQNEWRKDFASAAYDPSDGETVKMLDSSLGLTGKDLDKAVEEGKKSPAAAAKLIPRCVALQTFEEYVAESSGSAGDMLAQGGMAARVKDFKSKLAKTSKLQQAQKLTDDAGLALWEAARQSVQAKTDDDRSLYWARLEMARVIREWTPNWLGHPRQGLSNPDDVRRQKTDLLDRLELASRGMTSAQFAPSSNKKRILISGFDPFGLQGGQERRGNPSGAAVLALDGRTLSNGGVDAEVQGVIFPVRFADFDQGKVETFFSPFLQGPNKVDMVMTISQGSGTANAANVAEGFRVEQFAGAARSSGSFEGNLGQAAGGNANQPIRIPGTNGPQFLETKLPTRQIRAALGRKGPTSEETEVREIAAGSTRPRTHSGGPTPGSTAVAGSGGGFLSNEIFYRTSLLRSETGSDVPVGHLHTPYMPVPGNTPQAQKEFNDLRGAITNKIEEILTASIPAL